MSLVRRVAAAAPLYNSSSSALLIVQHDIVINNKTVCTTPGATLVASFTVSGDLRTTEKLMVTTTVLMTILGAALFLLGILGRFSGRHRGHSTATRIFFRASFALFLPFMSYMFSQAKSKDVVPRAQLILLWMLLVELLRKKVYAMVAPAGDTFARGVRRYRLFDAVEEAARVVWIGYLIYTYVHGFGVKSFFIILWIFSVVKLCKRAICIQLAKRSFDLAKNASLVSGYMAQLVKDRQQLVDDHHALGPNVMRTCNYVVMGESRVERKETPHGFEICDLRKILAGGSPNGVPMANRFDLVRVCTIWDLAESDPLFRYEEGRRRKLEDICLGLALFKLLRRRFEHCHMAEVKTPEARGLVLRGLLALEGGQDEATDADRAFEVVELELRFLDEYYQAIIPLALPNPALFIANFAFSMVFILVYCITVLLVTGNGNIFNVLASLFRGLVSLSIDMVVQFRCFRHQVSFLVGMVCSSSSLIVTFLLTLTLLAVETYEFLQYLLSDWFLASVLCNYARKPALRRRRHIRHAVKSALWVKHRSRPLIKVHQVTMLNLHQLHPRRVWMLISRLLKRRLVGLPDAVVTAEAKVAIIRALKAVLSVDDPSGGFSNGIAALRRHGFPAPNWMDDDACGAATVILAWHLATALIETRDRQEHPLPPKGQAALTLSRYCAYLVAYEPGLLPDDKAWTEKAYRDIRVELTGFFQSCYVTTRPRERLMQFYRVTSAMEKGVMGKGVRLFKQLEDMASAFASFSDGTTSGSRRTCVQDDERVWGMLLDFWAELLVFVARRPEEGPDAHTLALANGGEFITHIWAMLTHAGVRVRKNHHKHRV